MVGMLEKLDGKHIFGALAVGILAGVIWGLLDTYAVTKLETMVGLTPTPLAL